MRAQQREQGRFVAASGLRKVPAPPDSPYELFIVDRCGRPVSPLIEWFRRRKGPGPDRTRRTYLDMLLPFMGFLLAHGYAWNADPECVRGYLVAFLRERLACQVRPDRDREGYLIAPSAQTPLAQSSVQVLLAALRDFYEVLGAAHLYGYTNPLRSALLTRWKTERLRSVASAGAPEQAGTRGESWAESRRHPTAFFRPSRATVWQPDLLMETDERQQAVRAALTVMIRQAPSQRDKVVLLLLRYTGARLHEILGLTAGGYRKAGHPHRALVVNKGSLGREEKTIFFTAVIERALLRYVRTERAAADAHGRRRLSDLSDQEPLFLTRQGQPYTAPAFRYHWRTLLARTRTRCPLTFTPHTIRHLFVTEYIRRMKQAAAGDPTRYEELKDGFQLLMGWRSPATMAAYDHSARLHDVLPLLAEMQATWDVDVQTRPVPAGRRHAGHGDAEREPQAQDWPDTVAPRPGGDPADEGLAFWQEETTR